MLHTVLLATALLAVAQDRAPVIEDLDWLEGHWRAEDKRVHNSVRFSEELWLEGTAGNMFGIARTVRDRTTTTFEYMRVAEEGRTLVFIAQPNGAPPARFPMVRRSRNEIVFANPAHDYPQRIVYRREGDVLTATISLANGARPMTWTYRLETPR